MTIDCLTSIRKGIIGIDHTIETPYGQKPILYADWTASGRLYRPIEEKMMNEIGPYVANTHTESNTTGAKMTKLYHEALSHIKKHVNASKEDVILSVGTGATGAINKLQRLLGLRAPERLQKLIKFDTNERPVVFITHMEHHSNHISWSECLVDVVIVPPNEQGLVCPIQLEKEVRKYSDRPIKIGSFTACSNVTGVMTPFHKLARVMHENDGLCFIDFAASAPYVEINMRPTDPLEKLDAIFFSPHKFLGGPGTNGILLFDSALYQNTVPDHPGGGTVLWTNPWGEKNYISNIEIREDGGTPGFLQTIRTSLAIQLKEKMTVKSIHEREQVLLDQLWNGLSSIDQVVILDNRHLERLPIISLYLQNIHHNLVVRLLDERFGIQVRGGCSCAGTYGHYLLQIEREVSKSITDQLNSGDLSQKPGWIRISLHPTTTDEEVETIVEAIRSICENIDEWKQDYIYDGVSNEWFHKNVVPSNVKVAID
ncbi:aminotransferase class V-fold PLP-dependent enzyme [Bacillus sp. RG28]|uniref:Aminotransferase class V-fold PLP-dependent enzyme n=1 Tax=Gottfriedia endophytica TaxID=2820819 RepID=A0A940NRQ8_9BACI|nr:aminotransferase class V-fold PLP-dependent enzyme [Gottfriedia endophytica]MBP0725636.1 aminotransferase class V-fold PLP-dependent enzyme [Gottfriedia endophytica]